MLSSFASALRSRQTAAASSPPSGFRGVPPSVPASAVRARVRAGVARRPLRRRSGRDHDVLDLGCEVRLRAPLGSGPLGCCARGVPRARRQDGLATGLGLVALTRTSYGQGAAMPVTGTLVVANAGTTCAEFAGVAAGLELAGVSRYVSVPAAACLVGFVVLREAFTASSTCSCCCRPCSSPMSRPVPVPSRLG